MNSSSKLLAGLALLVAGLIPNSCLAQAVDWNVVQQLSSAQQIKVVMDDGKSYRGVFQSATDAALVIHSGSNDQTLSRANVRSVLMKSRGHRGRNALIGAGIGAGAGLGTGAAIDNDCSKTSFICTGNMGKAILTPVFGLMGAGIGALIPSGGWHEVYRSR